MNSFYWSLRCPVVLTIWILLFSGAPALAQKIELKMPGRPEIIDYPGDTLLDAGKQAALFLQIDSNLDSLEVESGINPLQKQNKTGSLLLWLSPDVAQLTIRRNGFLPFTIDLAERGLSYEKSIAWKFRLVPAENSVTLNFDVQPEDAPFYIDGKKTGRTKGVKLTYGKHRFQVEKPGFKKIDRTISIDDNTTLYEFHLKQWELQAVTVRSEPPGARFYLDDIEKGVTDKGLFLYPGRYSVKLLLSGFLDTEQEFVVKEGEPTEMIVKMRKNAGMLRVSADPPNAKILVNKEDVSGRFTVDFAPGKYQIEASAAGYDPVTDTFEIKAGEEIKKYLSLKLQTGTLQINVLPVETSYELIKDGWLVRRASGTGLHKELPAGEYTVRLWAYGFADEIRPFSIARESTSLISATLKNTPALPALSAETTSPALNARFILIDATTFSMGSYAGPADEKPVHQVTVSKPFYIAMTEITQAQWRAVAGTLPPVPEEGDDLPIGGISFSEAMDFIQKLNRKEPGMNYRLPTEAEWELAAGNGFSDSTTLDEYVWHSGNAGGKLQKVATRKPNERGLFDMLGNVWEWTADWYADSYYTACPSRDPGGPTSGTGRVMRGGSVGNGPKTARTAYRFSANPDFKNFNYGFRLVRNARPEPAQ